MITFQAWSVVAAMFCDITEIVDNFTTFPQPVSARYFVPGQYEHAD